VEVGHSEPEVASWETPPGVDAFEAWRSALCEAFHEMGARREREEPFAARIELVDDRPAKLTRVRSSGLWVSRTARQAVSANSEVVYVLFVLEGRATIVQGERDVALVAGGLQIVDGFRPFELRFHGRHDVYSYQVERAALDTGDLDATVHRGPLSRVDPAVRLLIEEMHALDALRSDAAARAALLPGFVSLLRYALRVPERRPPDTSSVRDARRRAVLASIAAGFRQPGFCVDTVAAELGVTPRYVHQLLEPTGRSFGAHVREARLDWAAAALVHRSSGRTVADVAADAGFGDLSSFHRAFKDRFGATPATFPDAAGRAPARVAGR